MEKSIYTKQVCAIDLNVGLLSCFMLLVTAAGGLGQDNREEKPPFSDKTSSESENEISSQ